MTKIVELHPDKALMNSRFEKYQFTSDIIPIESEINLEQDVFRWESNANQDSWLETRLFAFHNHLFKNPYDASCWFVDKSWSVWRINENGSLHQVHVFKSSKDNNEKPSKSVFNPSIGFASKEVVVLLDGRNNLEVLREDLSTDSIKPFSLDLRDITGIILDARYVHTKSTLIVMVCSIIEDQGKKCTQLNILYYFWKNQDGQEGFDFIERQTLKVHGAVEYAYIEEDGEYFHSISQDSITFENPLSKDDMETQTTVTNKVGEEQIKIPKYCWSQDEESLTVWITIPEKTLPLDKDKIRVNVTPTRISVAIGDMMLIEGDSQHRLDENLTTWKREKDKLQLELMKCESGLMWNELIKGDTGGEHLPNESLAAEVHSRLAHLCTDRMDDRAGDGQPVLGFNSEQLEECDLQGRDNLLQRINIKTQKTTHLAILGTSNRVLFTYKMTSGQAICLRHDHDGCLWMTGRVTDDNMWNISHTSTFPGFGYVEASKSNKKFCVSPADNSYVAIVEHTRHVFLYEKPERSTEVGKQWIIDIGCDVSPIMGATATNKHLTLLTTNKLYRLKIYP